MNKTPESDFQIRVCYADTDAGGVVYYGNYMRFMEQGRMELLRELGWCVEQQHVQGLVFPVREMKVVYKSPARLGDLLRVHTALAEIDKISMIFDTVIYHGKSGQVLLEAQVKNVCITTDGRLQRIPKEMREHLEKTLEFR